MQEEREEAGLWIPAVMENEDRQELLPRQRCKQPQLCLDRTTMEQKRNQLWHEKCCSGLCLRRQKPFADQEMPAGILLSAKVILMCLERKRLWGMSVGPSSSYRVFSKEQSHFLHGQVVIGQGTTKRVEIQLGN